MSLNYQNPVNFQHKLLNFIATTVKVSGWVFGLFPFTWDPNTEKYVLGSRIQRYFSALSIAITIISSIISAYAFKTHILRNFIDTEIDIILNMIIISFFLSQSF